MLDKDGIGDDIQLFNEKLREWEPHSALDGETPYDWLLARKPPAGVLPTP